MHNSLKWFARIAGLIFLLFFLAFFLGEGVTDIWKGRAEELITFLPFCIPALIGYLLAWKKPFPGGITMVIGAFIMVAYFLFHGDTYMAMIYGIPSLLVGLSFIASANKELV